MIQRSKKKSYGRIKADHVIDSDFLLFVVGQFQLYLNSMEKSIQRPLTFRSKFKHS